MSDLRIKNVLDSENQVIFIQGFHSVREVIRVFIILLEGQILVRY